MEHGKPMTLTLDTREPDPWPWERFLPPGWSLIREGLETGDVCVARLPDGVCVERKSPPDLAACLGRERERFERELRRGRHCGRLLVIVEGDFDDVARAAQGMHRNAVVGTVAAWSVRYCPFIFAGSVETAAAIAFRALASQVRDAERTVTRASKARVPDSTL
jgi:DNA excision repair protein ERCC-4